MTYVHAVGKLDEQALAQVEHYMALVHALVLDLTQIANHAEQLLLIVDLKGLKLKTLNHKLLLGALKKLIFLAQQYFPHCLYRGYIVNAPMFFQSTWNSLTPLLSPSTLAKFRVLGAPSDPEIAALVGALKSP